VLFGLSPVAAVAGSVAGDCELALSGNGTSDNDFDASTFAISGSFVYSLTDSQEIGVRQSMAIADSDETDTRWNSATRGYYNFFQFDLGRPQLFIGANLGYIW
jgi:hypothetical protein